MSEEMDKAMDVWTSDPAYLASYEKAMRRMSREPQRGDAGAFPSRGTYYLFVRGFLVTRHHEHYSMIMPHKTKTFRFVGAFPAGEQWTHIVWLMQDYFGPANVTYRFRA